MEIAIVQCPKCFNLIPKQQDFLDYYCAGCQLWFAPEFLTNPSNEESDE